MSAFPGEHTNHYLCLQLLQPRHPAQQLALINTEACPQLPLAVPATGSPGPVWVWALMQKENLSQRPRSGWQVQVYQEMP